MFTAVATPRDSLPRPPKTDSVGFVILLADHDEPSLAAKKKQRHVALETATSTPKNRVWGFESIPSGLTCSGPGSSWENAAGCVQYSYKNASGRTEFLQTDPLRFGGLDENLYRYHLFAPERLCKRSSKLFGGGGGEP